LGGGRIRRGKRERGGKEQLSFSKKKMDFGDWAVKGKKEKEREMGKKGEL